MAGKTMAGKIMAGKAMPEETMLGKAMSENLVSSYRRSPLYTHFGTWRNHVR